MEQETTRTNPFVQPTMEQLQQVYEVLNKTSSIIDRVSKENDKLRTMCEMQKIAFDRVCEISANQKREIEELNAKLAESNKVHDYISSLVEVEDDLDEASRPNRDLRSARRIFKRAELKFNEIPDGGDEYWMCKAQYHQVLTEINVRRIRLYDKGEEAIRKACDELIPKPEYDGDIINDGITFGNMLDWLVVLHELKLEDLSPEKRQRVEELTSEFLDTFSAFLKRPAQDFIDAFHSC